jgi:NAD(P)-dependent dehydrogenase (short-subunit alcohol dehydrogenase family)
MTSTSAPVILVLGAGPGLGMSVAHRFGKEGYAVAYTADDARRNCASRSMRRASISAA